MASELAGQQHGIGATWLAEIHDLCSQEDVLALRDCCARFFMKRAVLQSTPGQRPGTFVLKTPSEIADSWQIIMERRRRQQIDDRQRIMNDGVLAEMYTSWMHEWSRASLTSDQWKKSPSRRSSIFAAYVNNKFGGRKFIMAVWQTGVSWAPTPKMLERRQ